jgi:hypothetical protein
MPSAPHGALRPTYRFAFDALSVAGFFTFQRPWRAAFRFLVELILHADSSPCNFSFVKIGRFCIAPRKRLFSRRFSFCGFLGITFLRHLDAAEGGGTMPPLHAGMFPVTHLACTPRKIFMEIHGHNSVRPPTKKEIKNAARAFIRRWNRSFLCWRITGFESGGIVLKFCGPESDALTKDFFDENIALCRTYWKGGAK